MKGKNYTVIDDFLPKEEFEEIKYNVCNSESFAWSFVKHVSTNIETEDFPKGIYIKTVTDISDKKNEPLFLRKFRERAYMFWEKMKTPDWAYLNIPSIDYQDIQ